MFSTERGRHIVEDEPCYLTRDSEISSQLCQCLTDYINLVENI